MPSTATKETTLTRRELLELAEDIMLDAAAARKAPGYVRRAHLASPRDPAVQQLAAMSLVRFRKEGVTLEEIGKLLGVTRERVRQLEEKLVEA